MDRGVCVRVCVIDGLLSSSRIESLSPGPISPRPKRKRQAKGQRPEASSPRCSVIANAL